MNSHDVTRFTRWSVYGFSVFNLLVIGLNMIKVPTVSSPLQFTAGYNVRVVNEDDFMRDFVSLSSLSLILPNEFTSLLRLEPIEQFML